MPPSSSIPLIPWSKTNLSKKTVTTISSRAAQQIAIDLYALGFHSQADCIIEALVEYGPCVKYDIFEGLAEKALYQIWKETGKLPSCLASGKKEIKEHGIKYRSHALDIILKQKGSGAVVASGDIDAVLEKLGTGTGHFPFAKYVTVTGIVQVAVQAKQPDRAIDFIKETVPHIFQQLRDKLQDPYANGFKLRQWLDERLGPSEAPEIWTFLKDLKLGIDMGINEQDVDEYVEEGIKLIKQRFTQGAPATSIYRNRSIPE